MLAGANGHLASSQRRDQLVRVAMPILGMLREHSFDHRKERVLVLSVEHRAGQWLLNVLHQRPKRVARVEGRCAR